MPTLFTVGHGSRALDDFLDVLDLNGIAVVVDVRSHPGSRRHPHYSRVELSASLQRADIDYLWLGKTLGGFRQCVADSPHVALGNAVFRAFASHMTSAAFGRAMAQVIERARLAPLALMCAERLPQRCHRLLIADYLTALGCKVRHLLDDDRPVTHSLTPSARLIDGVLCYDGGGGEQLDLIF